MAHKKGGGGEKRKQLFNIKQYIMYYQSSSWNMEHDGGCSARKDQTDQLI